MVNALICDREELDVLAHRLIIQALQHSPGTKQRTQAIESLLALTEQIPGILTQQRLDTGLRPYYDEALRYTENSVRIFGVLITSIMLFNFLDEWKTLTNLFDSITPVFQTRFKMN